MDITNQFFESLAHIQDNKVVKSPLFDLLEGARAVEVTNPKLDTGLILKELTETELNFNCLEPIDESQLIGLMNLMIKLLMSWLNNSSLPVTVLSCRYVQHIVHSYTMSVERGMDKFDLGPGLCNKILKSFVVALAKFVGVVITVSNTVLYEEEDLTTRAMELDFLNEILIDEVIEDLDKTIRLVQISSITEKKIVVNMLELIGNINKLPIMFNLPIDLFRGVDQFGFSDILKHGILNTQYVLENETKYELKVPEGSISKYVQAKLGNRNIPGEIYQISFNESYSALLKVFTQLNEIYTKVLGIRDLKQLNQFLKYDIQLKAASFHVLTRGLFQLFFIRDDQKIFGSQFTLGDITLELMNEVNSFNCSVLNAKTWNLGSGETDLVFERINMFLRDLDVASYLNLTIYGHNRSRQRQLMNKTLLLWDSLQVQAETLEMDLFNTYQIADKDENGTLAIPLSSYVYYVKLDVMIEFLLLGIELELYKDYEILAIYWYLNYLLKLLISHMIERIILFNKSKLAKLTKQKKKLKNKSDIEEKRIRLIGIIEFMQRKLAYFQMFKKIINTVNLLLNYYQNCKIVEFNTPTSFISPFEKLFRLRFKPFESIGVPLQLTYQQYIDSYVIDVKKQEIISSFESIKTDLQAYNINSSGEEKKWVDSLIKTCVMYMLEVQKDGSFTMSSGYNRYFPKFK